MPQGINTVLYEMAPALLLLAGIERGRRSDLAGERGVHKSACECDWTPGQGGPQSVVIPSSLPLSLHSSHNWRENDLYDGEVDDDDVYVEGERTERRVGFIVEKRWVSLKKTIVCGRNEGFVETCLWAGRERLTAQDGWVLQGIDAPVCTGRTGVAVRLQWPPSSSAPWQ